MGDPLVTIVVPNWNTGPLLRLCLASVQAFTADLPHELVVVDNGSTDASRRTAEAAAAQGLARLVDRVQTPEEAGAGAHGAALDAGLAAARTPWLFTLDSDAWAREPGWLGRFLVAAEMADASHAGATKFPPGPLQRFGNWLVGRAPRPSMLYVRPCHALYRVDLLRTHGLSFAPARGDDGRARTVGHVIHERLAGLGYRPAVMPHGEVARAVGHVRHATFALNPAAFPTLRDRSRRRAERALADHLATPEVAAILARSSLP